MPNKTTRLKRALAWLATASLILALAPRPLGGISSAYASDVAPPDWEFTDTAQFTFSDANEFAFVTDPNDASDSVSVLKLDWTASGDADLTDLVLDLLETATANRVLAVVQNLADTILVSTDGGAAWSPVVADGGDPGTYYFNAVARNPTSGRIVLVGYKVAVPNQAASFYSDDQGATWTGPTLFVANTTNALAVVWNSFDGAFWAGTARSSDTQLLSSSTDGTGWALLTGTFANGVDVQAVLPISATVAYATGISSSAGNVVWYTTDNGANWSLTDNLGGGITTGTALALGSVSSRFQNILFAGTFSGEVFKSSADASGGWTGELNWTDISVPGVTKATSLYLDSKDNLFFAGSTGAQAILYFSIDGGNNWEANHPKPEDTLDQVITRLTSGIYLVGSGPGGGTGNVYRGSFYASASSYTPTIKANNGFAYVSLSTLTVSYPSSSELDSSNTQVKFKLTANGTDWRYWDSSVFPGSWVSTDESTAAESSTTSEIQTNISSFPPRGSSFRFKVFFNTTGSQPTGNSAVHIDQLAVTYTTSGGGDFKTLPYSQVLPLPEYTTTSTFPVIVEITKGSGAVKVVELWYKKGTGLSPFYLYGSIKNPKAQAQFSFDSVAAGGDDIYYFYSIVEDNQGYREPPPPSFPGYDASTTVDTAAPTVLWTKPANGQENVGINLPIEIKFSERMKIASLQYEIDPDPGGLTADWPAEEPKESRVVIQHSPFAYNRSYTVTIKQETTDLAGNQLREGDYVFVFTTAKLQRPDFTNSTKAAQETSSDGLFSPGETVEFTLLLKNTSDTGAVFNGQNGNFIHDPIPLKTSYLDGSASGGAIYNPVDDRIEWLGTIPAFSSVKAGFDVKIDSSVAGGTIITNAATIQYQAQDENASWFWSTVIISAHFTVTSPPSSSPPQPPLSPYIISTQPADQQTEILLFRPISANFSEPMNPLEGFSYRVSSKLGGDWEESDTSLWLAEWFNDNQQLFLTPIPALEPGTAFKVEIQAQDTDGNILISGPAPNPFSFITIIPAVVITKPAGKGEVLIPRNKPQPFEAQLQSYLTGEPYPAEEELTLRLATTSSTGLFSLNAGLSWEAQAGSGEYYLDLSLPQDETDFAFQYKDSTPTNPLDPPLTLSVRDYPAKYLLDDARQLRITSSEWPPRETELLFTEGPTWVLKNHFSPPFVLTRIPQDGISFPPAIIYLASSASTGQFYSQPDEASKLRRKGGITIQDLETLPIWELDIAEGSPTASFYYKDSAPGTVRIFASLDSTIEESDASLSLAVIEAPLEEEGLLEELIPVKDETGREIAKILLLPERGKTLPKGIIKFKAAAFDTKNKLIKNARFAWFAINGGGSLLASGLPDDSSQSLFTAGEKIGHFPNAVLTATLYNGKVKTASADVSVLDLTDLQPTLPSTGPNGLQVLLITIALLAAIALAWVEHYEKTYLAQSKRG